MRFDLIEESPEDIIKRDITIDVASADLLVSADDPDGGDLAFSWDIDSYDDQTINVFLAFKNPLAISVDENVATVVVNIYPRNKAFGLVEA